MRPLRRGESREVRGRVYLFEGDRAELLRRYREDVVSGPV
jgi:hypothetical protein